MNKIKHIEQINLALIVSLLCIMLPSMAHAQSTLAELTFGAGTRSWTGEVGERLRSGIGFEVEQELYVTRSAAEAKQGTQRPWTPGAGVKLGVFSFVERATQDTDASIPFNADFHSYHVQIGPRLRKILWKGLFIKGGVDYVRMNSGGGALTPIVGLKRAWHGGAASLRTGYSLEPLVVEVEGSYHLIPGLQGDMWGVMVRVGVISF